MTNQEGKFMKSRKCLQALIVSVVSGIVLTGITLAAPEAEAQGLQGPPPALSGKVLNQIKLMREEKKSRTPAQRKMSSQLVHAVKLRRGNSPLSGLPGLRSNVQLAADDTTLVDITAVVTPALLEEIEVSGGTVINSFAEYDAIRAQLPLDFIETLAERDDVKSIFPAARAFLRKTNTSEGDAAHAANTARNKYNLTGKNIKTGAKIKVGVLSDSVDWLSSVQSSGDLPYVTVLKDLPGNTGEGTAMLEIVHDLAPDANLYFATAFESKAGFANNIKALANAGCQVIVDDVGYLDESPFQDDILSQAVNTVTSQGVLYFSSAGNSGNLNDNTSGVWEGNYNGQMVYAGDDQNGVPQYIELHNFAGGDWSNQIVSDAGCYTLFWSDPLGASGNDYDLYLVDPDGVIVAASEDLQEGTQDPLEGFCIDGVDVTGYSVAVSRFSGLNSRFLHVSANRGRFEYRTAGQIAGHPAAVNAFAVSAVSANGKTTPFAGTEKVETFTTDGPRRVFYYANGTPITPGNLTATGGAVRNKPDISAADGVMTATPGFDPFYGTSAAAPHAAAIAALMLSGKPDLTIAQVRQAFADSAFDIEGAGWDRDSGYGLIMADRVLDILGPFRQMSIGSLHLLLRESNL